MRIGARILAKFKSFYELTAKTVVKNRLSTPKQHGNSPLITNNLFNSNTATLNSEAAGYHKGVKITKPSKIEANKDTPINKLTIISSSNDILTESITNNNLITEILTQTPVRAFDITSWKNKSAIINNQHSPKHISTDNNFAKLDISLQKINTWLENTKNKSEVVFLSFNENNPIPQRVFNNVFGNNTVLTPDNFAEYFPNKMHNTSVAPTTNELIKQGIRVVIIYKNDQTSTFKISNYHTTNFDNKKNTLSVDTEHYGLKQHFIDLNYVPSADDLGFTTLNCRNTNSLFLRLGAAIATITLAVTGFMCFIQGYLNENKIKKQDKIILKELTKIDVASVLISKQKMQKNSTIKDITTAITTDDVKTIYTKKQLSGMSKNTFLFGGTAIIGILSALLALAILFPPFLPALFGAIGILVIIGFAILLIAIKHNKKRLNQAINKSYMIKEVKEVLEKHVASLNNTLETITKLSPNKNTDTPETYINKIIKLEEVTEKLTRGETAARYASVISSIGLLNTYIIPKVIAVISSVASIGLGFSLIIFDGILNFIRRRKKLNNISQFTIEQAYPDYSKKQKRKLMLFGYTAIERFIYQDKERLIKLLNLPENTKFKDVFAKLIQPEYKSAFEKYLIKFIVIHLNKELKELANEQKPALTFEEISHDKKQIRQLLRKYIIKKVTTYSSRDTWMAGILASVILIASSIVLGMFFMPIIIVALGICIAIIGGVVSKIVAMREANLFQKRIATILDIDPQYLNEIDLIHKKNIEKLILGLEKIFYIQNI